MLEVLRNSWALLLGMGMLMLGNGLQGSLLGVRGTAAGFSTMEMSVVVSAYFVGFLFASRMTPDMIRRVGHVRVFAALGSLVSAVLILYPAFPHPVTWTIGRVLIGFCYCGVYVTAESWLNNASSNENRGQALSLYMIVQMLGIILAQWMLLIPDASGFLLFVIPSVLVSIAFAPILLTVVPTPAFETTKRQNLSGLFETSPLAVVGMFILGGVFSAQFGMAAVFATAVNMTLTQIPVFLSAFYVGALLFQYPLGWLSDRTDRRRLLTLVSITGAVAAAVPMFLDMNFTVYVVVAFVVGGCSNPLYSLLIAYANDYLETEEMAAVSAGLLFVNGLGAILGPLIVGWVMQAMGANGFFAYIAALFLCLVVYAMYRSTQRAAPASEDTAMFPNLSPAGTPLVVEFAQEYAIDAAQEEAEQNEGAQP